MGRREDIEKLKELDKQKALATEQGLDWRAELERRKAAEREAQGSTAVVERRGDSANPLNYIFVGFLVQAFGAIFLGVSMETDDPAIWVLVSGSLIAVGGVITLIGAVAMGVVVGLRARSNDTR